MFKELTNFKFDRNWKQAIGFYLSYFGLLILISIVLAGVLGLIFNFGYNEGMKFGIILSIIACPVISIIILIKKKAINRFLFILLSLVSGVVALYGGALLGLIIPAYLSTIKSREEIKQVIT